MFAKYILAAIALLCLGVLGWLVSALIFQQVKPIGPNDQNETGTYGENGQTEVPVTGNAATGTQTRVATLPDLGQAYDDLFQQILATKADFVPVTATSTGELKEMYGLYAPEIVAEEKKHPSGTVSVSVALVDVTYDGAPEALVYENLPDYCGSGGCLLELYQKKNDVWTKIYDTLVGPQVGISNTLTNGYLDLFFTVQGGGDYPSIVERFVWNDSTYAFKEIMAAWNGSSFELAQ